MQEIKHYQDIIQNVRKMGAGQLQAVRFHEDNLALGKLHDWPASHVVARTANAIQKYVSVYYDVTIEQCWDAVAYFEVERLAYLQLNPNACV